FLFKFSQPLVISPVDNYETTEPILFKIENANRVLISKDKNFTNPIEIKFDGKKVTLEPGEYFWKAESLTGLKSEIRTLKVISKIELKIRKINDSFEVVNGGNVNLRVKVFNDTDFLESFILLPEERKESKGNKFFGEEK
ncbi:MAG: hypothetical protein QW273_03565, partial [Candidatus Pacearchaeota archaeon]